MQIVTFPSARSVAGLSTAVMTGGVMVEPEMSGGVPTRAHLVWEDGFGARFLSTTTLLLCLALTASRSAAWTRVQGRLVIGLRGSGVLGLLSSSCCALQLALNAFSVGCAGFNTYLGPARPFLLALTLCMQALVWHATLFAAGGPHLVAEAAASTLLCASLTFLPEALHAWTFRQQLRRRWRLPLGESAAERPAASSAGDDSLTLRVDGMGCTACTVKVQGALEKLPGVAFCEVALESGTVELRLEEAADREQAPSRLAVEQQARQAIVDAGFGAPAEEAEAANK